MLAWISTFAFKVSIADQRWFMRFTSSSGVIDCTFCGPFGTGSFRVVESKKQPESSIGIAVAPKQAAIRAATLTDHLLASSHDDIRRHSSGALPACLKTGSYPAHRRQPPQSRDNRSLPAPSPPAATS